ncbi:MAG: hypothetical protein H6835_11825 [Planctomycetes bacterium]|nr:hypothetical protein [Planctomycetota bacterium]
MNTRRILAAFALLLAAACATPFEIQRDTPPPVADLEQFRQIQAVFREQNMGVHDFDFEGQGRVTVREITLDGFPGTDRSPYLRCRFHYQNRTAKPVVQAWVSLDVLDKDGRMVSSQSCHVIVPVPMPLARGSYYSDELRTPTYGAHLQEGWSWRIRCVADLETDEEPLDPPAPEPGLIKLREPVLIKNRN